ncbi:MAG: serpin family protein [Calditrichaeota bacterium]|nr:serpin family protein [Calditrichota bacterium]
MTRRIFAFSLPVLLAGLVLVCCSGPSEPGGADYSVLPRQLTPEEIELAQSSDRFGLKLFRETVRQDADKNIFISPLSVSMALGMTANGAAGSTLDSMRTTLELAGLTEEESNAAYQSLIELLAGADPQVQFDIANSIWYLSGEPVLADFVQRSRDYFEAVVQGLDFSDPAAADTINAWVKENTEGRIEEIVDKPIAKGVVMFLLNALYFKGTWTYEFDPQKTRDDQFNLLDGSRVDCRMMEQRSKYPYLVTDQFQAVDLPYSDGLFSMTIFLPRSTVHVDSLIAQFTPENWQDWISSLAPDSGDIQLPKFKLKYMLKMNDVLKALGMGIAFDPGADFTRMFQGGGVWIDKVKHKTFVQVDEEGTEASAVTVVVMIKSAGSGFYMRVDRPFVFVIRERTSGALLFMGKIVEPLWEEGQ